MDLFDRYFRTLRIFLPKGQREDIIRELSEEVGSQVADKEAALGRPLNSDEQAAIIGHYGHPLLTASRYRPHRYLVGPVVFPYYWLVLKVVVGLVVVGHVLGAVVLVAGGLSSGQVGDVFASLVDQVLKLVGWITVLAACVDVWLARSRILENWNPRAPSAPLSRAARAVEHAFDAVPGVDRERPRSWAPPSRAPDESPSISGFVVGVVLSAWFLLGLKVPYLFFGPAAADVGWGPAMNRLYPVLAVAQLTALASQFVRLTRPHDTRFIRMTSFIWLVTGWLFIYLVATSDHEWVMWRGAADVRARATIVGEIGGRELSVVDFVNYLLSTILFVVAAGGVVHFVRGLLRLLWRRRHAAAHA